MNEIVRVAVPRPLWNTYDYLVPHNQLRPEIGARVQVPLGHSRAVGVVIDYPTQSEFELKPFASTVDDHSLLGRDLVDLSKWISSYYHYPIGAVFETMFPAAARQGRAAIGFERIWHSVGDEVDASLSRAPKQAETWSRLRDIGPLPDSALKEHKLDRRCLNALLRKDLVRTQRNLPQYVTRPTSIELTDEQEKAVQAIVADLGRFNVHLLDGITGSGKTEVYLRAIDQAIARGLQTLVLVPEISLTPQTLKRFRDRFGEAVALHSKIPAAQRFSTWVQAAEGHHKVVIGTRSAVFTPFDKLGLIVIDEEHDASFKQSSSLRYSGRDVAIKRAQLLDIPCVLGSATPSMETLENVKRGRYQALRLSHRPGTAELPTFRVLDIRKRKLNGGMSDQLVETIREHVDREGQVIVLINRRGFSPALICTGCGYHAYCEDCDVRLTYHEVPNRSLQCHECARVYPILETCPECGGTSFVHSGSGTQRTEAAIAEALPDVPLYRIDRDTTSTNRRLERTFSEIPESGRAILVGTQMLAKGHHFPNVSLVAVLGADNGFLSSDFRAPERTAQLIVQVAGRAGRSERRGEVVIQTYNPENPDLISLVKNGYPGFIEAERRTRQDAEFPPFSYLAFLRSESENSEAAESYLTSILDRLRDCDVTLLGPTAAPISRISKSWRFQAAVLSDNRNTLHSAIHTIERERPKSRGVRWSIDIDPIDIS